MDGFFRRLQEVADLPTAMAGVPAQGDEAAAGMSRDELVDALAATERRAVAAEAQVAALRAEATDINDQFAAYKVKVNTWREQMKAARAQDRKTIDTLRQAASALSSSGGAADLHNPEGDGASDGGGGMLPSGRHPSSRSVDSSYLASLEEQVAVLKDGIRKHAAERDELQVELDRLKDRTRKDLKELAASSRQQQQQGDADRDATGGKAAPPTTVAERDGGNGGDAVVLKYASLVEQLEKDCSNWQSKYAALERANEALAADVDKTNAAIARATDEHARQLREVQAAAQRTTSAQYAKDLETEVAAYRRQLGEAHDTVAELRTALAAATMAAAVPHSSAGAAPREGSPTSAALTNSDAVSYDVAAAQRLLASTSAATDGASQRQLQRMAKDHEQAIAALTSDLLSARTELERLRDQVRDLEVEGEMREENLSSVFAETKVLRERLEAARNDLEAAGANANEWEERCRQREADVSAAMERTEDLQKTLEQSQRQLSKAQRDLNEKAEQVRQLKLADVQRKVDETARGGQVVPPPSSRVVSVEQPTATGAETTTPDLIIAARLQTMAFSTRYRQVAQLGRQVWSSARLRSYAVAAGLLLLVLVFTFSQGEVINEDATAAELLLRCKKQLQQQARADSVRSVVEAELGKR